LSFQEQYATTTRQSQQAWVKAFETYNDTVEKAVAAAEGALVAISPTDAVDQMFDFWEQTLGVQRDLTKQFASMGVTLSEKVRTQAESAGTALHEYAESAQAAIREQTAKNYDELSKAQLQAEAVLRDLPKSGTAAELRDVLVADDKK
jgi:hypothetical protein